MAFVEMSALPFAFRESARRGRNRVITNKCKFRDPLKERSLTVVYQRRSNELYTVSASVLNTSETLEGQRRNAVGRFARDKARDRVFALTLAATRRVGGWHWIYEGERRTEKGLEEGWRLGGEEGCGRRVALFQSGNPFHSTSAPPDTV